MIKIYFIHEIRYHPIQQSIGFEDFYLFIAYDKHFLDIKGELADYDSFS